LDDFYTKIFGSWSRLTKLSMQYAWIKKEADHFETLPKSDQPPE